MPPALSDLLNVALEAARAAAPVTLEYFGTGVKPEIKGDGSPVTIADKNAEVRLREVIRHYYPEHAILGEEGGLQGEDMSVRWVLDPIDGTKSFIHAVPLYGTLVACVVNGEYSVGVLHLPALNQTVYAATGHGCFFKDGEREAVPCRVSAVDTLAEAVLCYADSRDLLTSRWGKQYERLMHQVKMVRGWSDAYAYSLVATGRVEMALDSIMQEWDAAAMVPIMAEAGGRYTTLTGETNFAEPGGVSGLATNGALDAIVRAGFNTSA